MRFSMNLNLIPIVEAGPFSLPINFLLNRSWLGPRQVVEDP